jgi:ATP-binding cassette, subfamily B (MDR/TAP), member 1
MSGRKRPERTPTFADYLRLFRYATTWDFCVYAVASVASLGSGVTLPLMNIIFGQLVGQFTGFVSPGSSQAAMSTAEFHRLLDRQALYIMALFLGRWALNSINKFCFRMIGIRISSAVRLHYLRALFAQSVHVIDSMPSGAAATTITATANTLQLGVSDHLGTFLQHNGTIWAAFIIAFIWSWQLTLVTSSLIVYLMVVISILTPLVTKWQAKSLETAIASEALGGIRSVMAFGAQKRIVSRYEAQVDEAMRRGCRLAPAFALQVGLTVSFPPASFIYVLMGSVRLMHCTVLWRIRSLCLGLLVRCPALHCRRHCRCRSCHCRAHVRHDGPDVRGAHLDAPHGRQQGYRSRMRVLHHDRRAAASLGPTQGEHHQ